MILEELPKCLQNGYDSDSLVYYTDNEFFYNRDVDEDLISDLRNKEFQVYTGYYTPKIGKWEKWKAKEPTSKPTIYLIGRGVKSGKQKIKIEGFLPYCYMPDTDGDFETYLGDKVKKLIFDCNPRAIGDFRKSLEDKKSAIVPLEADIPFIRRFLCDTKGAFIPDSIIQPTIGIIDIETNFPINDDIISFAINDGKDIYFNSIHITKGYKDLITDLWERAKQFDVITNWNVEFDIDKINAAYKQATGNYDTLRNYLAAFNLNKETVKKLYGREIKGSWSLANAGAQIAKILKIDIGTTRPKDLPLDELVQYNCVDVIIPEEIDDVLGILSCHVAQSWLMQCKLEDTERTDIIDDISLLTAYHADNKALNSKPPYSMKPPKNADPQYEAAEPLAREGVYRGLLKFDVEQAYPTAVVAVNATPETKDKDGKLVAPNGVRFNGKDSTFVKALKHLLEQKRDIKEQRDAAKKKHGKNHPITKQLGYIYFAVKTQVAAFSHGEFGYWRSRTRDYEVAGAITSTAKDFIFYMMDQCDKLDKSWVYQHTDSIYIHSPKKYKDEIISTLNELGNEYCKEKGYLINFNLQYEDFYPAGYIHSPARNVLIPNIKKIDEYPENPDAWEVTGMNFMRAETPKVLSEIEINLVKMKLKRKSVPELIRYLKKAIHNIGEMDSTELGLIKPYNKPLHEYGGEGEDGRKIPVPYHIQAYIDANDEYGFELQEGEKFMVLPVMSKETTGKKKIKRVRKYMAFPISEGLPKQYDIDYENYLKSNLYGKIYKLFGIPEDILEECVRDYIPNIDMANGIVKKAEEEKKNDS